MSRPDYVHCIRRASWLETSTTERRSAESWCGRVVSMEWNFQNVDHALANAEKGGRQVACEACCDAIRRALRANLNTAPQPVAGCLCGWDHMPTTPLQDCPVIISSEGYWCCHACRAEGPLLNQRERLEDHRPDCLWVKVLRAKGVYFSPDLAGWAHERCMKAASIIRFTSTPSVNREDVKCVICSETIPAVR
jgi:hypothetical protein